MPPLTRTIHIYQTNSKLYTLSTLVQAIIAFPKLPEANQQAFKTAGATEEDSVVITKETIFHPRKATLVKFLLFLLVCWHRSPLPVSFSQSAFS